MLAVEVVPVTPAHVESIELRPGDAREIAALGHSKVEGLGRSIARSLWADAYLIDGEVAAIVGLAPLSMLGGRASLWLITGRPVDRHRKTFLRLTRQRLLEVRQHWPIIVNHVHADYREAIRWLEWLGFVVASAQPFGPLRSAFCRVSIGETVSIQPAGVADIERAANFPGLAAEYAVESLIDGLPPPIAKWQTYRQLEAAGLLHAFSATVGGLLVGFISVLTARLPRYEEPLAVSESFFVAKAHRKTGAGLRLLRAAEQKARELGSPVLLVSAPGEGDLARVLPRVGYAETNRVFCKKVVHD